MASKKEAGASLQSKSGPSSVSCQKSRNGPSSLGCHQSFRPILPCGNKLLQQRWDQTYYDQHRKMVKNAKPMVDTKPPPKRNHVVSKWKKEQTLKERSEEINRDNMTLLNKMQNIMHTQGCVDHTNSYVHHSLNQEQRQREQVRVARENLDLLKRIEEVEPMYKVSEWIEDWQRKEELANMITSFPNGVPTPPGLSVTPTTSPRDKTSGSADSTTDTAATSPRSKTLVSKTTGSNKGAKKRSKVVTISNPSKSTPTTSQPPGKQNGELPSDEPNEEPVKAASDEEPRATSLAQELDVPLTSQEATNIPTEKTAEPKQSTSSAESSESSHQSSSASSASTHSVKKE